MKKLLSLIAAIGLAATTTTTVVSCGARRISKDDNGTSKIDISKLNKIEIKYKENYKKIIELEMTNLQPKAIIEKDYLVTGNSEKVGSVIKVEATKESKLLTGNFTIKVKELGIINSDSIKKEITNKLSSLDSLANIENVNELLKDYNPDNIKFEVKEVKEGVVKITLTPNDGYLLNGSNSLEIKLGVHDKLDLKGLDIKEIKFNNNVEQIVLDAMTKFEPKAKKDIDFKISGDSKQIGSVIKVEATKESKLLTGNFTIKVKELGEVKSSNVKNSIQEFLKTMNIDSVSNKEEITNTLKDFSFNNVDKVELNDVNNNVLKITLTPKAGYKIDKIQIHVPLSEHIKSNLNEIIQTKNFKFGEQNYKKIINEEIIKAQPKAIENVDYSVSGDINNFKNKIIISIKENSKLLIGKNVEIDVLPLGKINSEDVTKKVQNNLKKNNIDTNSQENEVLDSVNNSIKDIDGINSATISNFDRENGVIIIKLDIKNGYDMDNNNIELYVPKITKINVEKIAQDYNWTMDKPLQLKNISASDDIAVQKFIREKAKLVEPTINPDEIIYSSTLENVNEEMKRVGRIEAAPNAKTIFGSCQFSVTSNIV